MKKKLKNLFGRGKTIKFKEIRLVIHAWAEQFRAAKDTIKRGLKDNDIGESKDGKYSLYEVALALFGDARLERIRYIKAKREREEFDLSVAKKDFIPAEDCARFIINTFGPYREMIVSLPGALAALCNPNDPAHARAHLERFRDDFLRLKEKMPEQGVKTLRQWVKDHPETETQNTIQKEP